MDGYLLAGVRAKDEPRSMERGRSNGSTAMKSARYILPRAEGCVSPCCSGLGGWIGGQRVLGVLHRVLGVLHSVLGVLHRMPGVLHRVLGVKGGRVRVSPLPRPGWAEWGPEAAFFVHGL